MGVCNDPACTRPECREARGEGTVTVFRATTYRIRRSDGGGGGGGGGGSPQVSSSSGDDGFGVAAAVIIIAIVISVGLRSLF